MAGWHHQFNGLEFEQAPEDGEGQESLVCCSPWGHKDRHDLLTERQKGQIMSLDTYTCSKNGKSFDMGSQNW